MSDVPTPLAAPLRPRSLTLRVWLAQLLAARAEQELHRRSLEKLAKSDDHLLSDVGITREEALRLAPQSACTTPDWWLMMGAR